MLPFTDRLLRALGLRFSMACIETLQTTQMAGAKIICARKLHSYVVRIAWMYVALYLWCKSLHYQDLCYLDTVPKKMRLANKDVNSKKSTILIQIA